MIEVREGIVMAKKTSPPPPELPGERVTVLNLKGSVEERDYLKGLSRKTGVPAAEIARRGMAMWAIKRGAGKPPVDWIEE